MKKKSVIKKAITFLRFKNFFKYMNDIHYLKMVYWSMLDKKLNLNNPQTFNEKLQWLKLYDRKSEYSKMVDKYEVKKYVSNIIGEEYVIPTLGVYDNFDDINFDQLPNQFVIKCTHDSGGIAIVKDKSKIDINGIKTKIEKSLKRNYYYPGREWPYKNVKPRIMIEPLLIDRKCNELRDYKFFCFKGKAEFFKIDFDRFVKHQANYYDVNGNLLKFGEVICPPDYNKKLDMPYNLKKMIKFAETLSKNICFLRVDFYEVENKLVFGELTFFPASGFGKFCPNEYDAIIGDLLKLTNGLEHKDEK